VSEQETEQGGQQGGSDQGDQQASGQQGDQQAATNRASRSTAATAAQSDGRSAVKAPHSGALTASISRRR
jgi:hypothetical protein